MYIHPAFRIDLDTAMVELRHRAFGTFVVPCMHPGTASLASPMAVHVPFLTERRGAAIRLEFHVARANPIHVAVGQECPALFSCLGPDAYVSPDWLGVPNQEVPTWTYSAVHVTGVARPVPESEAATHLDRLSELFESRLVPKKPWTREKLSAERQAALLRTIVVIELLAEAVEAQWKLFQHKGETQNRSAMAGLRQRGDAGSLAVADRIESTLSRRKS